MDIWGQKSIFCLVIAIFVDGTNDHYTRGYNFPIGTTPKKISVSELGVIFWGSPLFLAVFGHSHFRAKKNQKKHSNNLPLLQKKFYWAWKSPKKVLMQKIQKFCADFEYVNLKIGLWEKSLFAISFTF